MGNDVPNWDRLRVFLAVAEAGSFTRAAERLGLSQSAVSRQIGALEEELGAILFHRHARGLVLTEQGEVLLQAAREMAERVNRAQALLSESRERPAGHIRVNTTVGLGTIWLTSHLAEFCARYPEITISLLVTDADLDLTLREADVAIRLSRPRHPDLVARRLMTGHTHIYGSADYLDRFGRPRTPDELDRHRLVAYGEEPVNAPTPSLNWVLIAGRDPDDPRPPRRATLTVNNVYGMLRAAERGVGLASLPDYLAHTSYRLERVLPELEGPTFTAYFIYPGELRHSKRIAVFRDFLLEKVAEQPVW